MKSLSKLFIVFSLLVWGLNTVKAQTSLSDDKAMKATEVNDLISNKNFVFEATHIQGKDSLNYHEYDVAISKDTLIANLPSSSKGPIKITSTDFTYNTMKDKKGNWNIVIKPKGGLTSDVKQLNLNVTPQGHASLRVITYNRGPLVVDGYIKQENY